MSVAANMKAEELAKWGQDNGLGFVAKDVLMKFAAHCVASAEAEQVRLEELVCDFQAAAMIDVGGMNGPCCVEPKHVEKHVTELRAEIEKRGEAVKLLRTIAFETCSEEELFAALRRARDFFGVPSEPKPRRCEKKTAVPHKRRRRIRRRRGWRKI